ncbi:alpha/beta fold hydrolase [Vibrio hepatarius]|uniref:alpha/beta fold hydrolase n=1 Tax=Vibrio hepatarius TaxID=171383 RepID=UPI001C0809CD|nr:alpha/beta fold hydrolase [Vibrio hepatarius]MBU2895777.1 alpha/beta fold hydrolase [Vibrio hepatarius]
MSDVLIDGEKGKPLFIFAHGAGADMNHDFMATIAKGLAERGIQVIRFNFPYMVKRSQDGKRRPPDRAPKLLDSYRDIIKTFADKRIIIGGKSMGGRMASLLSQDSKVAGIACLGFPFHPPGKPENYKGEHLATLEKECLILQGERDTFGKREECHDFELSNKVRVEFIPDGDHSFKPRKSSGQTEADNIALATQTLADFILEVYGEG